jgi:hypothetical protein
MRLLARHRLHTPVFELLCSCRRAAGARDDSPTQSFDHQAWESYCARSGRVALLLPTRARAHGGAVRWLRVHACQRKACVQWPEHAQHHVRELVLQQLPDSLVLGQVPVMSLGCQGRDWETGLFTRGSDLIVDMMVRSSTGVWYAIEICGPEHRMTAVKERDRKKAARMRRWSVQLIKLRWRKRHLLPVQQWQHQLADAFRR